MSSAETGPHLLPDSVARHPALRRITVETPVGPVAMAAPPAILSDGPRQYGAVPAVGAQSMAIRSEFAV